MEDCLCRLLTATAICTTPRESCCQNWATQRWRSMEAFGVTEWDMDGLFWMTFPSTNQVLLFCWRKQKPIHCLCKLSLRWRWESRTDFLCTAQFIPLPAETVMVTLLKCKYAVNFLPDCWTKTPSRKGRNCCSDLEVKNQSGESEIMFFLVMLRLSLSWYFR